MSALLSNKNQELKKEKMTTLKEAQEKGKIKDFIKERTKEEKRGDKEKFDKAIKSISQTSSKAPKASTQGNREN